MEFQLDAGTKSSSWSQGTYLGNAITSFWTSSTTPYPDQFTNQSTQTNPKSSSPICDQTALESGKRRRDSWPPGYGSGGSVHNPWSNTAVLWREHPFSRIRNWNIGGGYWMLDPYSRVFHRSQESLNVLVDGSRPLRSILTDLVSWIFTRSPLMLLPSELVYSATWTRARGCPGREWNWQWYLLAQFSFPNISQLWTDRIRQRLSNPPYPRSSITNPQKFPSVWLAQLPNGTCDAWLCHKGRTAEPVSQRIPHLSSFHHGNAHSWTCTGPPMELSDRRQQPFKSCVTATCSTSTPSRLRNPEIKDWRMKTRRQP